MLPDSAPLLLDVRTIAVLVVVNAMAIAVSILLSARNYPQAVTTSLRVFSVGRIAFAAGFVLLAGRGDYSPWVSVVLANTLGLCGLYMNLSAIRILQDRTPLYLGAIIMIILSIAIGSYSTLALQDLRGVRLIVSLLGAVILGRISYELLWKINDNGAAHIFGGCVAVLCTALCLWRVISTASHGPIPVASMGEVAFEQVFLVFNFAASTINTVNFILLCNDRFNSELWHLATTDPMTGLANRRRLVERAGEDFLRAKRFNTTLAVLVLDIDHFKRVNDQWGHGTGDQVIQSVATLCTGAIRDVDFMGRVGGEEFVILLPSADRDGATQIAERLRSTVENTPLVQDDRPPIHTTISIGAAILTDQDSFELMWEQADAALYRAKNGGRNQVVVD